MKVLLFDTETTGLPSSRTINPYNLTNWPHIVQFSFVVYDSSTNIITETYNQIINIPTNAVISPDATEIHRITNEMSRASKVTLKHAFADFFYNLNNVDMIAGHNIEFDINMIRVELLRFIYGGELSPRELKIYKRNLYAITSFKNVFCTLKETVDLCNIGATNSSGESFVKYPKLAELHEKLFSTTPNSLHNSMVDILVTLRCFVKIKYDQDLLTNCRTFKRYVDRFNIYITP